MNTHRGWHSRGYLPHFDAPHTVQAITFHLGDSVPAETIAEWRTQLKAIRSGAQAKDEQREEGRRRRDSLHSGISAGTPVMKRALPTEEVLRRRIQTYLDMGHGDCSLRNERIAKIVQDALLHFDGQRYRMLEWVVMPNHVHVIAEQKDGHSLSAVVHAWKSFTAKECNRVLRRTGKFWWTESYDRYIRSDSHYFVAVRYLRENPVKAGLCSRPEEWQFSSAHENAK